MNASLSIPTMSIQEDVDLTALLQARDVLKAHLTSRDKKDAKLTITTLFIKVSIGCFTSTFVFMYKLHTIP